MNRKAIAVLAAVAAVALESAAGSVIEFTKPQFRWLWGGFGFHNAEASMTAMMTPEFRDQRAAKTLMEIGPTYSRVFAGFSKWTKEEMDRFADYYDLTFRRLGTTLYVVPCRMPMIMEDFDCDAYAEQVAANLEYVVKTRGLKRIAFYCATNEMSVGPCYGWFHYYKHLDLYKQLNRALYRAFRRHDLEIGLMAPDASGESMIKNVEWAVKELPETTEVYCWHYYDGGAIAGDLANYARWTNLFDRVVHIPEAARRRVSLGEFGLGGLKAPGADRSSAGVMRDGRGYVQRSPSEAGIAAMSLAEMGIAAMNAGFVNAVVWTMTDYPDPFLGYPGGETQQERGEREAKDRAAFALDQNYNKWGVIRWCDDERDYRAYPSLYTLGYLMKLFRRGGRVLPWKTDDPLLRAGGVTNADGSCTLAVINWGDEREVEIRLAHRLSQPMRVYRYDSANPPENEFNDLQSADGTISQAEDGTLRVRLGAKSMAYLTTDYLDRLPPAVTGVKHDGKLLTWNPVDDADHRYYRVYLNGRQIASTIACSLAATAAGDYSVVSVDRWGNCRGNAGSIHGRR